MQLRCEPVVVSVQRSTAKNAVEGHLAWGVLTDQDRVVVPGPLDWLRDPTVAIEVLLASSRRANRGVVERIRVERAEVLGPLDRPDDVLAVLQLVHGARHRPNSGELIDGDSLLGFLAEGRGLWGFLESSGVVPPGLADRPVHEVLRPVVRWEEIQRAELVRERPAPTASVLATSICCIFRCRRSCLWCDPDGLWW